MTAVFAESAAALRAAGWTSVFPLPRGRKAPPPAGVTGARRWIPSGADVHEWASMYPGGNVAIGMPQGVTVDGAVYDVIGVDVDHYEKSGVAKSGLTTITKLEADAGAEFPGTVKITSRGDNPSGKFLYRVPAGVELVGTLASVELLQHFHRYAVAPPSTNPDSDGTVFEWRTGARPAHDEPGRHRDVIPRPEELSELPGQLVEALRRDSERARPVPVDPDTRTAFFRAMPLGIGGGIPCVAVRNRYRRATTELMASRKRQSGVDGRHDTAMRHVLALMRLGEMGHLGVREALRRLRATFLDVTADRAEAAAAEWSRMLRADAIGLILATPTGEDDRQCLCPEGIAALFATYDNPEAEAADVGIDLSSVLAAINDPTVRAAVEAVLGGTSK